MPENEIALLVIDMQNLFVDEIRGKAPVDTACAVINHVAERMRAAGAPVFFVQDVEEAGQASEEELDFIPELTRGADDILIKKTYSNAFWKTGLNEVLEKRGVNFVILAGQAAEHCVLFTYNGAREQDLRPVLLQDAILSGDRANILNAFSNRNFISWIAVQQLLDLRTGK